MRREELRTAVVTGAAGGIGRALAERLLREGLQVVVVDHDAERLAATAEQIGATGAIVADLASDAGVADAIDRSRALLGKIDLWCGNAGIETGGGLDASDETWARATDINVLAHVRTARRLVPEWIERDGGHYVVTASAAGLLTMLGSPAYSVTKHGAVAFAEWLSATYRHRGVVVQAICPQGVRTRMLEDAGALKGVLSHDAPLEPSEVAATLWEALETGSFLVLPHPEVAGYYRGRAADTDRWLGAMNRIQQVLDNKTKDSEEGSQG